MTLGSAVAISDGRIDIRGGGLVDSTGSNFFPCLSNSSAVSRLVNGRGYRTGHVLILSLVGVSSPFFLLFVFSAILRPNFNAVDPLGEETPLN